MTRTALITGVSGQDGSYLAELLRSKGYRVVGLTRSAAAIHQLPYAAAFDGVELVEGRLEAPWAFDLIRRLQPDEVYHLASPSSVSDSFADPAGVRKAILGGAAVVLEGLQQGASKARCFLAGSCEVFAASDTALDEAAPCSPASPYGEAKLAAWNLARTYRTQGDLYAVTGVLFNHESPRRGEAFVSRKIVRGVAAIARGDARKLHLGNLDVRRDWGFAGDTVRAMWAMLQQDSAADLVIGAGEAHSVADFCAAAFAVVGLDWREHVSSDPSLVRAVDVPVRLANPARARRRLEWSPEVDFPGLVSMMVNHEMAARGSDP